MPRANYPINSPLPLESGPLIMRSQKKSTLYEDNGDRSFPRPTRPTRQKSRKFDDVYEANGEHARLSGGAKRVMDFFRRIGA